MEKDIIIWLQQGSNKFLDVFFSAESYVVSWIGVIFLFLVILIFVDKRFGLFFGASFLITIAINYFIKVIVNRPRPYETYAEITNKLTTVGKSFPSGHAVSVTFMVLTILYLFQVLNKKAKFKLWDKTWFKIISICSAVLLIVITAIARMYLGQHYISDILAGIVLSSIFFYLTTIIYKKSNLCH